MAFTLKINFSGLCLFAPEQAGGIADRMHALLPKARGHTHGPDRHIPVLMFDTAHLRKDSPVTDRVTAVTDLTSLTLRLPDSGVGADLRICPDIVNLSEVTGKAVYPDHFGRDTRGKLAARVTLTSGRMTAVSPGVCWEFNLGFRRLAHEALWEIASSDDELVLQLRDFDDNVVQMLEPLHPIPESGGVIDLFVAHIPASALPPDPEQVHEPEFGFQPRHFTAYYSVFGEAVPVELPKYWGVENDCLPIASACPVIPPSAGGSVFDCMLAGAW